MIATIYAGLGDKDDLLQSVRYRIPLVHSYSYDTPQPADESRRGAELYRCTENSIEMEG